jgi:hypothetical protein
MEEKKCACEGKLKNPTTEHGEKHCNVYPLPEDKEQIFTEEDFIKPEDFEDGVQEWEEEFDKKMKTYVKGHGYDRENEQDGWWLNEEDIDTDKVKSFIKALLQEEREKAQSELLNEMVISLETKVKEIEEKRVSFIIQGAAQYLRDVAKTKGITL